MRGADRHVGGPAHAHLPVRVHEPRLRQPLRAVQSFTDPAASECPVCGGPVRKVFSAVGVVFKGSGFYRTDSRAPRSSGGELVEGVVRRRIVGAKESELRRSRAPRPRPRSRSSSSGLGRRRRVLVSSSSSGSSRSSGVVRRQGRRVGLSTPRTDSSRPRPSTAAAVVHSRVAHAAERGVADLASAACSPACVSPGPHRPLAAAVRGRATCLLLAASARLDARAAAAPHGAAPVPSSSRRTPCRRARLADRADLAGRALAAGVAPGQRTRRPGGVRRRRDWPARRAPASRDDARRWSGAGLATGLGRRGRRGRGGGRRRACRGLRPRRRPGRRAGGAADRPVATGAGDGAGAARRAGGRRAGGARAAADAPRRRRRRGRRRGDRPCRRRCESPRLRGARAFSVVGVPP